jgi:flagellar biosynthesis protein
LEPRPVAIALRYDPEKGELPRVTARGRGRIAERIIALARQAGVPVRADPDLAQLLVRLEAGSAIPVEAFAAVAEILALLYRENARLAASPAGGMR